jgi:hypothetical protein
VADVPPCGKSANHVGCNQRVVVCVVVVVVVVDVVG